jgi:hypothetical protein
MAVVSAHHLVVLVLQLRKLLLLLVMLAALVLLLALLRHRNLLDFLQLLLRRVAREILRLLHVMHWLRARRRHALMLLRLNLRLGVL